MMIKPVFLLLISLFSFQLLPGQTNPVSWTFETKKISDKEFELSCTATINGGWYIYSQYLESEDGPIATAFTFEDSGKITFVGKTEEQGHKKEGFDDMFGMNIIKYADTVVFVQRFTVQDEVPNIHGFVTFMTCNDEKCLPPRDVNFNLSLL